MQPKYCQFIQSGINFHLDCIKFCNQINMGPIISEYNDYITADEIEKIRQKYIDDFSKGIVYPKCVGCSFLKDKKHLSEKIDYFEIFHWHNCNCGCIYCANLDITKGKFSDKVERGNPVVLKLLKEMYAKDMISKDNIWIGFGGGEVTVLKEFPKFIDLFLENQANNIYIQSSGITYSKTIEKALKSGKAYLQICVAAGSREVYKKIKRRDKYNQVVNHIKKYLKAAKIKENVISKYIIYAPYNSSAEEIKKWLDTAHNIGVKKVELSMEFCHSHAKKRGQKVEQYYYDLFDYAKKYSKEIEIEFIHNYVSKELMEAGVHS